MKTIFLALIFCFLFGVPTFAQEVRQIDEFKKVGCDEYLARMDNAMIEAQNNPSATVYVLIYEGKEQKYNSRKDKIETVFPAYGSAKAKINSMKKYLAVRKFPINRFSFVNAGFREDSVVELWLVPNGENPPKPSPTLTKMKYRKGKATGFCTWCCGEQ